MRIRAHIGKKQCESILVLGRDRHNRLLIHFSHGDTFPLTSVLGLLVIHIPPRLQEWSKLLSASCPTSPINTIEKLEQSQLRGVEGHLDGMGAEESEEAQAKWHLQLSRARIGN